MAKTVKEMREILYNTVKKHGCYFKRTDLHFKKKNGEFTIIIEDYDHIPFRLMLIDMLDGDGADLVVYVDTEIMDVLPNCDEAYETAMREIGHYVGNRF